VYGRSILLTQFAARSTDELPIYVNTFFFVSSLTEMGATEMFRSFVVELLTLAFMMRSSSGLDGSLVADGKMVMEYSIRGENLYADYLSKQLDILENEFNTLSPAVDRFALILLWLRIVNLEGILTVCSVLILTSHMCLTSCSCCNNKDLLRFQQKSRLR
jgi:hypothetical protein